MKPARLVTTGLLSLLAAAGAARADLVMLFSTGKDYIQSGPFYMDFEGGDLSIFLRDGIIGIAPCDGNGGALLEAPNIFCPLGTTGFIAAGDADGDGVRDDLAFWSIAQITPALVVEPFFPQYCELISAPPSELPRPLGRGQFQDRGVVAFYNLFGTVLQWNVTIYEYDRAYPAGGGGRRQMEKEVVIGQYIFSFPRREYPTIPVGIPVTHPAIPEGNSPLTYPKNTGFRFNTGYWYEGVYLIDPRFTSTFTWQGNNATNTYPGRDDYQILILDEDKTTTLFPPAGGSVTLPNAFVQEYNLPPFFLAVGQSAYFQLRLQRLLPSSGVAYDASVRIFGFRMLAVDTYQGFRLVTFPTGEPVALTAGTGDYDEDGQSNLLEFALQSDPTSEASKGTLPVATQDDLDGTVFVTVPKRPAVANTLTYQLRISEDGGPFVPIGPGNPQWEITEDDEFNLTIRTFDPAIATDFEVDLVVTEVALN